MVVMWMVDGVYVMKRTGVVVEGVGLKRDWVDGERVIEGG